MATIQRQARANYRRAVRGTVRQSRFDEMMAAVTGRGSKVCVLCRMVRPVAAFDEHGHCNFCRAMLAPVGLPDPFPQPPEPTAPIEANVVYVDASFREGIAGLAVVGEIGQHSKKCRAPTSTAAEVMALRWAFELAETAGYRGLVFRTDCQAAFNQHAHNCYRLGWIVEQVPRHENQVADRLASTARQRYAWN